MSKKYIKEEQEFLADVRIDYDSLSEICGIVTKNGARIPIPEEFQATLDFIQHLAAKYGEHFHYTWGPGVEPIDTPIQEFIHWLQEEYNTGRYKEIYYSIWFHLDPEAIPKKYQWEPFMEALKEKS